MGWSSGPAMLVFFFNNPSFDPTKFYNFSVKVVDEKNECKLKKEVGVDPFLKTKNDRHVNDEFA